VRRWTRALPQLANAVGLEVTVCHVPPGTSQWHTIAHRLFGHLRMKWRGQPLIRHEVMVDVMGTTTTKSGVTVTAHLDTNAYPITRKVSNEDMASLNIRPHAVHGEWN
jgi:Rhodopirellula transposase DDE domain